MSNLILRKEMPINRRIMIDEPFIDVIYAVNALPGIIDITTNIDTLQSIKDSYSKFRIHFTVDPNEPQGLFFLTRCTDRRYWQHGHEWEISLSVGDTYDKGILPVCYMLQSGLSTKETMMKECESLFENMNYHIHHEAFMTGFKIDVSKFSLMNKTAAKRTLKLNDLGI